MISLAYLATTLHCWLMLQLVVLVVYRTCLCPHSIPSCWCELSVPDYQNLSRSYYVIQGIYHHIQIQITKHFKGSPTMPSFKSLVKTGIEPTTYHCLPFLPSKSLTSPFYCCLCLFWPLFSSSEHPSLSCHLHHATHTKAQHFNGMLAQQSWLMPLALTLHKFCLFLPQNTVSTRVTHILQCPAQNFLSQSRL